MAWDDFPKFFGTDRNNGLARTMLDELGGSAGFKKRIVEMGGETIMLETKNGMPRLTSLGKKNGVLTGIVETLYSVRTYFAAQVVGKLKSFTTNIGLCALSESNTTGADDAGHYPAHTLMSTDGLFALTDGTPKSFYVGSRGMSFDPIPDASRDATKEVLEAVGDGYAARTFFDETYLSNVRGEDYLMAAKLLPVKTVGARDGSVVTFKEPTDLGDPPFFGLGTNMGYRPIAMNPFDHVHKFGFPYHGIHKIDGRVTLTSGTIVDLGIAVAGGSVWAVKKPGLGATEAVVDSVSAELTWKNYALLSGKEPTLYGKDIGGASVFFDGDGKPFVARAVCTGSRVAGTVDVTLSVKALTDTWASGSVIGTYSTSFAKSSSYPWAGSAIGHAEVIDVSPDGRKILVGVTREALYSPDVGYCAIAELVITGDPGAISATFSLLADESSESWKTLSTTGGVGKKLRTTGTLIEADAIPPLPSGWTSYPSGAGGPYLMGDDMYYMNDGPSFWSRETEYEYSVVDWATALPTATVRTWAVDSDMWLPTEAHFISETKCLVGARYDTSGAANLVYSKVKSEDTISDIGSLALAPKWSTFLGGMGFPPVNSPERTSTWSVTSSAKSRFSIEVGGVEVDYYQALWSGSGAVTYTVPAAGSTVPGTYHVDFATTYSDSDGFSKPRNFTRALDASGGQYRLSDLFEEMPKSARQSNAVYALCNVGYSPNVSEEPARFIRIGKGVGKIGVDPSHSFGEDATNYATEHPVTGEVVRSTSQVCWI